MSGAWIESIGSLVLLGYCIVVVAVLGWMAVRLLLRGRGVEPVTLGGIGRFLIEYVGNVDVEPQRVDRRRNRQARVLMDHVKQEMLSRDIDPSDADRLMENLREVVRTEGQGRAS